MQTDDRERVTEEFNKRLPQQGRVKKAIVKALHRAKIVDRTLLLRTIEPLPRDDLGAFYSELGAMHGAVATARPENVDLVIIEDTAGTGQRITVRMRDLLDHAEGKTALHDYIRLWKVDNPRKAQRGEEHD